MFQEIQGKKWDIMDLNESFTLGWEEKEFSTNGTI